MIRIVIPGELTDLNNYIRKERGNRYAAARIKQSDSRSAYVAACRYLFDHDAVAQTKYPLVMRCHWYVKNRRKDPDNIAFAKKFILDGFQKAELIAGDSFKHIKGFEDYFYIDKKQPRVEVELIGGQQID